ncbi:MAG: LysR family transcriptional regulator [Gammaproteobacteria bacterium]|nr:LysR family transcriptional regulator [Gammaproteobacteria bacterium]
MGILDDSALFVAIIQQGGFSHAAKHLGLSNGLISRRIAQLEATLGVTLIKRTTRQIHLTPEGELFLEHALKINQELNTALSLIQASAKKPKGVIHISAPLYFGRKYLTPMLVEFMNNFPDIHTNLILSNKKIDPIKYKVDLIIRGAGFVEDVKLKDSTMQMKLLLKEKIGLYASPLYLQKKGTPTKTKHLPEHTIINFINNVRFTSESQWKYCENNKEKSVILTPSFNCNDIESSLTACIAGNGIGRFTELNVLSAVQQNKLYPVLSQYDWGDYHLFAIYPQQKSLPRRTRLLLDFIDVQIRGIYSFISGAN